MAFCRALRHRLIATPRIRSSPPIQIPESLPNPSSILRHFLSQSVDEKPLPKFDRFPLPIDRIRFTEFDPLIKSREKSEGRMSIEEARRVLKAVELEAARARLRAIPGSSISYSEFLVVCGDSSIAQSLDESGAVIVLGDVVLLCPDQVAKALEGVLLSSINGGHNDPRREELREMEAKKFEIDRKAKAQVKRELWFGLSYLAVQTLAFIRLTFWELSWDVMEPICAYVTSFYFISGYTFFLRTSKDPSFQGFSESRFATKQKRLMREHNFDLNRFSELQKSASHQSSEFSSSFCGCHRKSSLARAVH